MILLTAEAADPSASALPLRRLNHRLRVRRKSGYIPLLYLSFDLISLLCIKLGLLSSVVIHYNNKQLIMDGCSPPFLLRDGGKSNKLSVRDLCSREDVRIYLERLLLEHVQRT